MSVTERTALDKAYSKKYKAIDVSVQDQTSDVVDFYLMQELDVLAIATDGVIDNYTLELVDASAVIVGNYVGIQSGDRNYQGKVLSINVNQITLDTPLDFAYPTTSQIIHKTRNLNVDGSTTPIIARLGPVPNVTWDITRIIMVMQSAGTPDDSTFGDIASLTNGIVLRSKGDTKTNNFFTAHNNGELAERMFDVVYTDKAGGGNHSTRTKRTFSGQDKNGVVVRLDGDNNEEFQIIIQDNLSTLVSFHAVIQGHIVEY